MQHGYVKVAAVTPEVRVADPEYNARQILQGIRDCAAEGAGIIVLPELCLSAATCQDLFLFHHMLEECRNQLRSLAEQTAETEALIFVGLPWEKDGKLYNVAAALQGGRVLALIPQTYVPDTADNGKGRYFTGEYPSPWGRDSLPSGTEERVTPFGYEIPFGSRILLQCREREQLVIGCEIGEDLWAVMPPSLGLTCAGANVIVHLSAMAETVTADQLLRQKLKLHSRQLTAAYLHADAGEGESTQDMVFAGRRLIAECGELLAEGEDFSVGKTMTEIDLFRLTHERKKRAACFAPAGSYRRVCFSLTLKECELKRTYDALPFVPKDKEARARRCEDIFRIQIQGLKKRLRHTGSRQAVVGVSGGLDSTLALLVTAGAFDLLGLPREQIQTVTMPCFGTTDRTYDNACRLAKALGASLREVDIRESVLTHFRDIGQDPGNHDVTYENAQARERTQVLMDIANQTGGLVIGTGDLSELALGWATYNGDHMSMYGVNGGVPKTLIRYLVRHYADTCGEEELKKTLLDILDTPVSPELLPPVEGTISQKTEDLVGPYELHDFFLYHMLRSGFSPSKIDRIAAGAFQDQYDRQTIRHWLKVFCRRFFAQQFKRSCLPDGPKTGSLSLSPRGGLMMPSDAVAALWLKEAEGLEDE
ncbi:MAG: NAD(+) synthase [Lachnospiraceae bacterium]|nr:NAD(+) synthase [Lachnospiraceae bacterium]